MSSLYECRTCHYPLDLCKCPEELTYAEHASKTNDGGEDTSLSVDETLAQRGNRYGKFSSHAELSQSLSNSILIHIHKYNSQAEFSSIHLEAISMICHKLARIANGDPNYDDNWRDIAGYATLVEKHINGEDT